ncbi:MAG: hypothetical protein K9H84_06155 [Bacteroidales bacterium]|nr:hypothetical protein [Bacteroidales bacterium]
MHIIISKTNQVILTDIRTENGETIAILHYHIQEYVIGTFNTPFQEKAVDTMMDFDFNAVAKFNVDRGYWKSFDGLTSLKSNGLMESNMQKKFALIQLKE